MSSGEKEADGRRQTYRVWIEPWAEGLELHISGVGVTQAETPAEADYMVRDLVARRTGVSPDSFDLCWLDGPTPQD